MLPRLSRTPASKADRLLLTIQFDEATAAFPNRFGEFVFAGNATGALCEAPYFPKAGRGNIVCPARLIVDFPAQREQFEQRWLDVDRFVRREGIDAADFAFGTEV